MRGGLRGDGTVSAKNHTLSHWLMLAACCGLAAGSIGLCFNCSGIFFTSVARDLGVGQGAVALSLTLTNLMTGLLSPVVVTLMRKVPLRLLLIGGVLLAVGATLLMAGMQHILVFYVLSLLRGLGACMFSNAALSVLLNNWFEKRNGFAVGLAFCFSGVGGTFFNPLLKACMESMGWRTAYLIMAALIAAVSLPGALFVRLRPEEKGLVAYGASVGAAGAVGGSVSAASAVTRASGAGVTSGSEVAYGTRVSGGSSVSESSDDGSGVGASQASSSAAAGRSIMLSILLSAFAFFACYVTGFGQHLSGFGESIHMVGTASAMLVSASMVGNIVFKLLLGLLSDKIGAIRACMLLFAANLLSLFSMFFLPGDGVLLPILVPFLYGTCFAITSVGMPLVARAATKPEQYDHTVGIMSMMTNFGGAVSLTAIGALYDWTGSYGSAIGMCAGVSGLCLGLLGVLLVKTRKVKTSP